MPKRFRGYRGLADFETRAVDRAVRSEQCRLDALSAATAGPGIGQAQRVQRAGDELLAADVLGEVRAQAGKQLPAASVQRQVAAARGRGA